MKEVIRDLGVSEQTYYRWRREYGGMKTSQAKRLKELEKENQRLKRAVESRTHPSATRILLLLIASPNSTTARTPASKAGMLKWSTVLDEKPHRHVPAD